MTICPTDAVTDFYRIKLIGKHGSGSRGAVLQRNRIGTLLSLGRSQVTLQAEIIALRHQLIVLQRAQNLSPKTASEVMVC